MPDPPPHQDTHAIARPTPCQAFLTPYSLGGATCRRYDQMLYGERLDGMFASCAYFIPKAVGAFASALPLTILYSAQFDPPKQGCPAPTETAALSAYAAANLSLTCSADVCVGACAALDIRNQPQSDGVLVIIRLLTGALPAIVSLLAAGFKIVFYLYPEHMPQVQHAIATLSKDPTTPLADPVTGQMVTWLTDDMCTDDEYAIKERLDVFFYSSIARAHTEGNFNGLHSRAVRNAVITVTFVTSAIAFSAYTVSLGWLRSPSLNIFPTVGCICIGLGCTVSAIIFPRLSAANHLKRCYGSGRPGSNPYPSEFLDRYIGRFKPGAPKKTQAVSA